MKTLPRVVIVAGVASFLTDMSTEMIYPLLPLFLTRILGATPVALGIIEGFAETTASILKILSGIWADRMGKRKPLVVFGYGISGIARPLIGLATLWPHVLIIRVLDRVGKGIRGTPRDALIADAVPKEHRGRAYGFHRMMDNAGAITGPIVAWALLATGLEMRTVFLLAIVPGIVVMGVLVFGLKEPEAKPSPEARVSLRAGWRAFDFRYKWLLLSLFVFALGMSADAFILMRLSEAGFSPQAVALLWALLQGVKAPASYWGGALSDAIGRRRVVLAGWAIYAAVYIVFGLASAPWLLVTVFLVYGLYFGLVEPAERAWVVDLAPKALRGTALGYYNGVIGLACLPADILFGLVWHHHGSAAAFGMGAAFAAVGAAMLVWVRPQGRPAPPEIPRADEG